MEGITDWLKRRARPETTGEFLKRRERGLESTENGQDGG
jgi:hypothetical protein